MPSVPGARLAMVKPKVALGAFETFFDGPAQAGGGGEFGEPDALSGKDEIIRAYSLASFLLRRISTHARNPDRPSRARDSAPSRKSSAPSTPRPPQALLRRWGESLGDSSGSRPR